MRDQRDDRDENADRPKRARVPITPFDQAMRFLKIRDHSERELRVKLRRKQISAEDIDATIEKARRLGFLDDARFASARAESLLRRGKLGPRGVSARLGQAGVARGQIQTAVKDAMEGHDEAATVRALVMKRFPAAMGTDDRKLRAKAIRFLLGRGFSSSVVGRVLDEEIELADSGGEP